MLPLFFFLGGYVHLRAWHRARARGESLGRFVRRNLRRLSLPAFVPAAVWITLGASLYAGSGLEWIGRAVLLVISPLWFLGVYLVLIALIPLWFAVARRFGPVAFVWMIGLVVVVDILRFRAVPRGSGAGRLRQHAAGVGPGVHVNRRRCASWRYWRSRSASRRWPGRGWSAGSNARGRAGSSR